MEVREVHGLIFRLWTGWHNPTRDIFWQHEGCHRHCRPCGVNRREANAGECGRAELSDRHTACVTDIETLKFISLKVLSCLEDFLPVFRLIYRAVVPAKRGHEVTQKKF